MRIETALELRETIRDYTSKPISLDHLSQLLWAAQGKRGESGKLNAPSAGGQYPLTVFVVAHKISEIGIGIFQYKNTDHSLEQVLSGEFRQVLSEAAIGEQPWIDEAAAIIILTAHIESMNEHFTDQPPIKKRGERYVYIETGAVAQNIQLQGTALNIGMVFVGGFKNDRVKSILKLPKELEPTALLCVGNV